MRLVPPNQGRGRRPEAIPAVASSVEVRPMVRIRGRAGHSGQADTTCRRGPGPNRDPAASHSSRAHRSCPGTIGAGSAVSPINHRSTAAAQDRPSAIAHTIKLCPLVMSPQTKTPGWLVAQPGSQATFPRSVEIQAELRHHSAAFGSEETHRDQHEVTRYVDLGRSGTGSKRTRPFSWTWRTC